ncbi:MAG TPA: putative glycolipid-binding domain-containing protein [Euzebyales bacterium]|nr:putative glycolipid-binding domain-containing protein [Euzebyales bacterium]
MTFTDPPTSAAWRHQDAREGFEAAFFHSEPDGHRVEGHTTAIEDSVVWSVRYTIALDRAWGTRRAHVVGLDAAGTRQLDLLNDGAGHWRVNGQPAPHLDGCIDVDLESSALTNALPVHRLALEVGDAADAPAAYVRAPDLGVERLDQHYLRTPDEAGRQCFAYEAPRFSFNCRLVYDEAGLVLHYPGLATRVA